MTSVKFTSVMSHSFENVLPSGSPVPANCGAMRPESPQRGAAVIPLTANYAKLVCDWIWVFSQPNYPKEEHKHSNWILAPRPPNYPEEEQKHTCSVNKSFPWCSLSHTWRFCVPVDNWNTFINTLGVLHDHMITTNVIIRSDSPHDFYICQVHDVVWPICHYQHCQKGSQVLKTHYNNVKSYSRTSHCCNMRQYCPLSV